MQTTLPMKLLGILEWILIFIIIRYFFWGKFNNLEDIKNFSFFIAPLAAIPILIFNLYTIFVASSDGVRKGKTWGILMHRQG